MTRSDHVLIPRTGQPALRLDGYGLCASASSRAQGALQTRWHEIDLWADDRAPAGPEQRHCIAIRYRTQWDGERGHDHAAIVLRRGIGDAVRAYDPCAHVAGYPPGTGYEAKQDRLLREIRSGYEHAVSDLLAQASV